MSRLGGAVVGAVAAALLTACVASEPAPLSSSSSESMPTGLPSRPAGIPEQRDDGTTGTPMPTSTLMLDDSARTSALDVGVTVMTLFARRDVPADQWIDDLTPYLTAGAAQAYRHTDPLNVPPTRVTGEPTLTPDSTPLVGRVAVPTDDGVYLVILSRDDEHPNWLADRIMPPEGHGDS